MTQSATLATPTPIRVAILGAGHGGLCLLDLLSHMHGVTIVGIADRRHDAPGLQRALDLDIPIVADVPDLIRDPSVTLIVDVTGDPAMETLIARYKADGAETLSGTAARLLWELIRHETELRAEISHADKLASLGSFAAGIAHDINNPLYLIMGLAEDLLDHPPSDVVTEHAQDIIHAVQRTSRICSDLTRYARRTVPADPLRIDLHTTLDESLKIGRHALLFQDMTVVRRYDARTSHVLGNPDEVLHLFVNLITNAIHAMNGHGQLTLSTRTRGPQIEAAIADTGTGIAPDTLPHIFEPFFTTKAPGHGTGLGLYNVKTITEQMGGTIAVDSQLGQGTTFTLSFPSIE